MVRRIVAGVFQIVFANLHEEAEAAAFFLYRRVLTGLALVSVVVEIGVTLSQELLIELLDDFVLGLALHLGERGCRYRRLEVVAALMLAHVINIVILGL